MHAPSTPAAWRALSMDHKPAARALPPAASGPLDRQLPRPPGWIWGYCCHVAGRLRRPRRILAAAAGSRSTASRAWLGPRPAWGSATPALCRHRNPWRSAGAWGQASAQSCSRGGATGALRLPGEGQGYERLDHRGHTLREKQAPLEPEGVCYISRQRCRTSRSPGDAGVATADCRTFPGFFCREQG
jgi:hypothetical protein